MLRTELGKNFRKKILEKIFEKYLTILKRLENIFKKCTKILIKNYYFLT